ncbi:MAG: D-sedoheptulose 7-phosphate isomerase [Acidobacteria bacterium]|nr:D-sedoheptulose 7-phosphate isomerase [Acidobacteriota bacterium]
MNTKVQSQLIASIQESIAVKQAMLARMVDAIETASEWLIETLRGGHKVLLFGNGGSAADAQHVAAELIGRFEKKRRAWPAIALTTDTSVLTALANDEGLDIVFARQIEALGEAGDLVLAFSTSGNSRNVLEGVKTARAKGLRIIGLTGESGGKLAPLCDLALRVPSQRTARIQEAHITICHLLCEVVEAALQQS